MSAALVVKERVRGLVQRASGRIIWRGPSGPRRVALTFDDGPDDLTAAYLDVLDRHGAAATFFVMGDLTEQRRELIPEYVRRGHQLGGHGYDHTSLTELSIRQLVDQLDRTDRAIGPVAQGRAWMRPPYGALNARALATVLARGYTIAMWSLDSYDFKATATEIEEHCRPDKVEPGEVILFHEGYQSTLAALPRIIDGLHDAGYELVTMADLVAT